MNIRNAVMILTAATSLTAGSAFAADVDLWLVNKTGLTIREIHISENAVWGADISKADLVANQTRFVTFKDAGACIRDVKVVFAENASEAIWEGLDLCSIDKLSLAYNVLHNTVASLQE